MDTLQQIKGKKLIDVENNGYVVYLHFEGNLSVAVDYDQVDEGLKASLFKQEWTKVGDLK